jgi:hypothetical protein
LRSVRVNRVSFDILVVVALPQQNKPAFFL